MREIFRRLSSFKHGWKPEQDIYDAIVVASLRQVRLPMVYHSMDRMGRQQSGRGFQRGSQKLVEYAAVKAEKKAVQYLVIHPFFLFIPAIVLFGLQILYLMGLFVDFDPTAYWIENKWEAFDRHPYSKLLLVTKCAMCVTLQVQMLHELLVASHGLMVVINPFSLKRRYELANKAEKNEKGSAWWASLLFKWVLCFFAKLMQLCVVVFALKLSMTICLQAETVTDVIFNGLVLEFVIALDESVLSFLGSILNIDMASYEEFEPEADLGEDETRLGWGRDVIVHLLVAVLYIDQLLEFMLSVETGILPAVRDACAILRTEQCVGGCNTTKNLVYHYLVIPLLNALTPYAGFSDQMDRLGSVAFDNAVTPHEDVTLAQRCVLAVEPGSFREQHPEHAELYHLYYSHMSFTHVQLLWDRHPAVVCTTIFLFIGLFMLMPCLLAFLGDALLTTEEAEEEEEDAQAMLVSNIDINEFRELQKAVSRVEEHLSATSG